MNPSLRLGSLAVVLLAASTLGAQAQTAAPAPAASPSVRAEKNMSLELANEIAGAAVFLASPAGSFMTGQHMIIDGGVLCGAPANSDD